MSLRIIKKAKGEGIKVNDFSVYAEVSFDTSSNACAELE